MSWPKRQLGDVLAYEQPTEYLVRSKNYSSHYSTPVLTPGKSFLLGYTNETDGIFPKDKLPVIIFDDFTTATQLVDFPFKVKSSAMKILHADRQIADTKYLYYKIKTIDFKPGQHKRHWISEYSKLEIVLPPLGEQKLVVKKIETIFKK